MIGDVAAGLFVVALLYMLARPNSAATQMVTALFGMATKLLKTAIDM